MFGSMFSGLFGGKNTPMPNADLQMGDAFGQAAMGSPGAFGQGMPTGGMDKNRLAMMLMQGGRGFGMGAGGFGAAQMPQLRNVYQNMTPMQAPGQQSIFDHIGMTTPEERARFMRAMQQQGYGRF